MSVPDPQQLPEARLVPKDGADRMAILRGQAADGARKVGRVAVTTTKAFALIALCGVGLVAIGAGASRSRSSDWADRSEHMRRVQESLRSLRQMPKIDFSEYYKKLRTPRLVDPTTSGSMHETGASPSQATSSR